MRTNKKPQPTVTLGNFRLQNLTLFAVMDEDRGVQELIAAPTKAKAIRTWTAQFTDEEEKAMMLGWLDEGLIEFVALPKLVTYALN